MPIYLPEGLPAARALQAEGIAASAERPAGDTLRIALLNLMPQKPATELQLARLLAGGSQSVELTLFVPDGYLPKTTSLAHMEAFYRSWSHIREERFDGLIVTGAPVEHLPFEEVSYWPTLCSILDWARREVPHSFYICWAAQAAMQRFHGVPKQDLPEKRFGVFPHRNLNPQSSLLRGLPIEFPVPVSRHTEVRSADLPAGRGVDVLLESPESGLCLLEDAACRAHYMFNHLEYETDTLAREYRRDLAAGQPIAPPRNYFPGDDPEKTPQNCWQPCGQLLFRNWLDLVESSVRRRGESEKDLAWLLSEPRRRESLESDSVDFLVNGQGGLDLLPCLLHALATMGRSPTAVKTHFQPDGLGRIELRVDRLDPSATERIARHLLRQRGVRCVTFRGKDGVGGIMTGRDKGAGPSTGQVAA